MLNSFEPADQRRVMWVDSVIANGTTYHYPAKYKSALLNDPVTEYSTVLRLAEQYLIRAEARAQQNNFAGAAEDLNIIRSVRACQLTPARLTKLLYWTPYYTSDAWNYSVNMVTAGWI